jgi:REP element-mobilizing transposase RayT
MNDKFQHRYRISSTRMQNWDYRWNAAYFITICTQERECFFGEIVDGKMNMSPIGIIADVLWHETKNHFPTIDLGAFVVMPNHIHGVLIINGNDNNNHYNTDVACRDVACRDVACNVSTASNEPILVHPEPKNAFMANISPKSGSVSTIIRSYKSAVTRHAHRLGFAFQWQTRFYDIIIRNDESFQRITEYIINNPIKWTNDKFYENT